MNRKRIWDRGWVLVRLVWASSGLLQTVRMWCLFSLDKLFCLYSTLTLGSPLVIYLISSWCLCSFPIWCLGQKCQFSIALLIYGMCLKWKSEMRSFKSNGNIHKTEDGSYYVVSANKASSVTLQSPGNESQTILQVCEFQTGSRFKDWYKSKWGPNK